MHERLQLREAPKPATLVVVRFGRATLADENLRQSCEVSLARWGAPALDGRPRRAHHRPVRPRPPSLLRAQREPSVGRHGPAVA